MKNVVRKPIVYDEDEEDLEALRLAALSTIGQKKKYTGPRDRRHHGEKRPFFRLTNNPNLIAIVPVDDEDKDCNRINENAPKTLPDTSAKDSAQCVSKVNPSLLYDNTKIPKGGVRISPPKEVKIIPHEVKKISSSEVKNIPTKEVKIVPSNEVKKVPPNETKKITSSETKMIPPNEDKGASSKEIKNIPPTEVKKTRVEKVKVSPNKETKEVTTPSLKEENAVKDTKSDISLDTDELEDKLDFEFEESDDDEMNFLSLGDDEDLSLDKLMDQMEQEFNSVKVKKKDKPKKVAATKKTDTSKKEEKAKKDNKKDSIKEEEKENIKTSPVSEIKEEVVTKEESKPEEKKVESESALKIVDKPKESPPKIVEKLSSPQRRAPSPYRSPVRRRTPPRRLSPVPRRRSLSPRRRSLTPPPRRRGPSPYRDRSPWRWSPRRRSRSPLYRRSRSPVYRRSRSPAYHGRPRFPSPGYRRSLSPSYRRSRSPPRRSRSPLFRRSRSPAYRRSPVYRRSFSPRGRSPYRRRSPHHDSPPRRRSPLSPRGRPLSPLRKRSPLSPRRSRRSPDSRSTASRHHWDGFSYESSRDDQRDTLYKRDSQGQRSMKEKDALMSVNEPVREGQVSSTSTNSDHVMEARRRKFESKHPVDVTNKTVRLNRDVPVNTVSTLAPESSVPSSIKTVQSYVKADKLFDGKPSQLVILSDDSVHVVRHQKSKKSKEKKRSKKKKLSSPDTIGKKKKIAVKIDTTSLDAPTTGDDLRAELSRRREKRRAAEEAAVEIVVIRSPSPPEEKPMISPPLRLKTKASSPPSPRPVVRTMLGASRLVQSALEGAVRSHTAAVKKAKSKLLEESVKPSKSKESKKKEGKIRRVKLVRSNPHKRKKEDEAMIILSPTRRAVGGSGISGSQV